MLASKPQRAAYITALLDSKQKPFIWEYFRPGTIELARGEENYYDEVGSASLIGLFSKTLHIRNAVAPSSRFLSSAPSRHTLPRTAFGCNFHTKTMCVRLVPLPLQQQQ
jgi:hypothetical protein